MEESTELKEEEELKEDEIKKALRKMKLRKAVDIEIEDNGKGYGRS